MGKTLVIAEKPSVGRDIGRVLKCGNFTIDWRICAAGCVKSVSGTLSVIVESDGC